MKENRQRYSGYISSRIPETARAKEKNLPRQIFSSEKPLHFDVDQGLSKASGDFLTTRREFKLDQEKYQVKELEKLIQKIDENNEELRSRRRRIAELEAENIQMASFRDECESARAELEKVNINNRKLRDQIEILAVTNAESINSKNKEIESRKAEVLEINALLKREKESHNQERTSLTREIKEMHERLNDLSAKYDSKMEEFKFKQEECQQEKNRMLQQIQDQSAQLEELKRVKQCNEEQIHGLQTTNNDLVKQLECYRQDNSLLTASILNEKDTLTKLDSQYSELKQQNEKLEQSHLELREVHDFKKEELEKFKNLAQRQDQTIKLLKTSIAENKEESKKQENTIKMLNTKLEILQEDNEKLKRNLEEESQNVKELEDLVRSLNAHKSELEEQHVALSSELQRLTTEISSFSALKRQISEARLKEVRNLSRAVGEIYPESN